MANFTPRKKTAEDFNNGVAYVDGVGNETGDAVQAETINGLVESALYSQEQADIAVQTASDALGKIDNALSTTVVQNGAYPNMAVGTATNDSTGRNIAETTNKNLYNLGAFDTYTANVVHRNTGIVCLDDLSWEELAGGFFFALF